MARTTSTTNVDGDDGDDENEINHKLGGCEMARTNLGLSYQAHDIPGAKGEFNAILFYRIVKIGNQWLLTTSKFPCNLFPL